MNKYDEARTILQKLLDQFADTQYVRQHEQQIKALLQEVNNKLAAIPIPVAKLWKGKVKWDQENRFITILYDFSSEEQLDDWESQGLTGEQRGEISWRWEDNNKTVIGRGRGYLIWKTPLEGDVQIEFKFSPRRPRNIGAIICGSETGEGYMAILGFEIPGPARRFLSPNALWKLLPSSDPPFSELAGTKKPRLRSEKNYHLKLARKGREITLLLDRKRIVSARDAAYNKGYVGLLILGSSAEFDQIRIRGRVSEEWLKLAVQQLGEKEKEEEKNNQ
jgi:hypothetical protein